jgi:hypothetical protein
MCLDCLDFYAGKKKLATLRAKMAHFIWQASRGTCRQGEVSEHGNTSKQALRASPAVLPKSDYLNVCLGSHLFFYYSNFAPDSNSTA